MTENLVLALEHVSVTTPKELEEEVLGWYVDVLGLERIDKPENTDPGGGWFRIGDQQLHLLIDPHNPPKNAHFCVRVTHLDDVVETLRSHGCHIEQARELPGRKRCFTRDPAGNSIELVEVLGEADA